MAILEGKAALVGPERLSLKPVKNEIELTDAEEYIFEFWPGPDHNVFSRIFSVANWQMQHDDVWVLARAFAEASALTEATISIDLWRTGKPAHSSLYENVSWLHVILWGNRRRQGIAVRIFVQENSEVDVFRTFFLNTSVEQAVKFGMDLESEIIALSPAWALENEHTQKG